MNIVDLLLGRLMSGKGSGGTPELPALTNPARAADIRYGMEAVDGAGRRLVGSMPEVPAVVMTLDTETTGYSIPAGIHDGEGWVGVELEEKTVDLTESAQEITPTSGKVLSKVTVPGVTKPKNYVLVTPSGVEISAVRID